MSRRLLITGASRGLGWEIASRLTAVGHHCIGVSRTPPKPVCQWAMVHGDQSDAGDAVRFVAEAEARLGGLDGVVLNAGVIDDDLVPRMSPDRFKAVIDTNLIGSYNVLHAAAKSLTRARNGRIIFIGSTAAFTGGVGQSNYAASKAGLVGLARSAAWEFARRGTTVNIVAPGLVHSEMAETLSDRIRQDFVDQVPMRRLGYASEVADAVEFLASDHAAYMTGAVLPIDGGYSMGL